MQLLAPAANLGERTPSAFLGHATMLTVEDCRRKAREWLCAANEATDPNTAASSRRLSDTWTALALQIEHDPCSRQQPPTAVTRPVDLAEPRKIGNTDTVQAADVLRERLQLSDFSMDEPPDSTSGS